MIETHFTKQYLFLLCTRSSLLLYLKENLCDALNCFHYPLMDYDTD